MAGLKRSVGPLHPGTLRFSLLLFRHNALPLVPFALAVILRQGRRRSLQHWLLALSIFLYVYNAVIVALVLGIMPKVLHMASGDLLLRGILPHGIFEIGAFSLLLAACFGKPARSPWRLIAAGYSLLALAAVIESFVTPLLLGALR